MSAIDTLRNALIGSPPDPTKEPSREGVLAAVTELDRDLRIRIAAAAASGADLDEVEQLLEPMVEDAEAARDTALGYRDEAETARDATLAAAAQIDETISAALGLTFTYEPVPGEPVVVSVDLELRPIETIAQDGALDLPGLGPSALSGLALDLGIDPLPGAIAARQAIAHDGKYVYVWTDRGLLDALGFGPRLTAAVRSIAAEVVAAAVDRSGTRAGWLHVFTDSADLIAGGFKCDGTFWTTLTGNVDTAIAEVRGTVTTLGDRQDAVEARAPSETPPRSGWLHAFTDSLGFLLGGWKADGSFWTAITGNIDAAISALRTSVSALATTVANALPIVLPARSGWLHVFTDSLGNRLFGAAESGDFVIGANTNVSQFFRDGGVTADLKATLYPTPDIAIYGDSLTENAAGWPALAAAFAAIGETRNVYTWGLGGQGSPSILARQGATPALVTFPANARGFPEIPAGTAAVAVSVSPGLLYTAAFASVSTTMVGMIQTGQGAVRGTLTRAAGGNSYTFARSVAGTAVEVEAAVPIIPDNAERLRRTQVCFINTNEMNPGTAATTQFDWMEKYAARQTTLVKRTVLVMPIWDMSGTNRRALYDQLLALVKAKYGHCYVDTVAVLQRAVVSPDATDQADIAAGLIPRSILNGDRLHFPAGGVAYQALAVAIRDVIKRNGW